MKAILGSLICASGLPWLVRKSMARRRVTIVVYHDPDPQALSRHLAWFKRRYTFITLDELADALDSGRWDRLPVYPLVLTFDDGHRGNVRLAPVLHGNGVRPTVFLCSRIVGTDRPFWWKTEAADRLGVENLKRLPDEVRREWLAETVRAPEIQSAQRQAMTWLEARALQPLCDFGTHTCTHPILTQCNDYDSRDEVIRSKEEVETALGHPSRHFAYPNGDYGNREIMAVYQAGYRTARTIEPGWNGPDTDPLRLKAMAVSDDAPVPWLAVQATGLPALLRGLLARLRLPRGRRPAQPLPAPT